MANRDFKLRDDTDGNIVIRREMFPGTTAATLVTFVIYPTVVTDIDGGKSCPAPGDYNKYLMTLFPEDAVKSGTGLIFRNLKSGIFRLGRSVKTVAKTEMFFTDKTGNRTGYDNLFISDEWMVYPLRIYDRKFLDNLYQEIMSKRNQGLPVEATDVVEQISTVSTPVAKTKVPLSELLTTVVNYHRYNGQFRAMTGDLESAIITAMDEYSRIDNGYEASFCCEHEWFYPSEDRSSSVRDVGVMVEEITGLDVWALEGGGNWGGFDRPPRIISYDLTGSAVNLYFHEGVFYITDSSGRGTTALVFPPDPRALEDVFKFLSDSSRNGQLSLDDMALALAKWYRYDSHEYGHRSPRSRRG